MNHFYRIGVGGFSFVGRVGRLLASSVAGRYSLAGLFPEGPLSSNIQGNLFYIVCSLSVLRVSGCWLL